MKYSREPCFILSLICKQQSCLLSVILIMLWVSWLCMLKYYNNIVSQNRTQQKWFNKYRQDTFFQPMKISFFQQQKLLILNIMASLRFTNVHQITEKKQIYNFMTEYSIPQVSLQK